MGIIVNESIPWGAGDPPLQTPTGMYLRVYWIERCHKDSDRRPGGPGAAPDGAEWCLRFQTQFWADQTSANTEGKRQFDTREYEFWLTADQLTSNDHALAYDYLDTTVLTPLVADPASIVRVD